MNSDGLPLADMCNKLNTWLETVRRLDGYSGPVVHWWQNCLHFTGAGLDWRYEGIIIGYLNLYKKTGDEHWLSKARRAGDDLVRGQLVTGNFGNSRFELNPYTGGTPHEASCDLALLHIVVTLREEKREGWQVYLEAARRNITSYYVNLLCDPETGVVMDHPRHLSFVPNKAATAAEMFLLLSQVTGQEEWMVQYGMPTLNAVLSHQVQGGSLDGAIHQLSVGRRCDNRFFPYYIARCITGLLAGYEWSGKDIYLDSASRAMAFILRHRYQDGSFPQVVYPGGRANRYPQWIAASGDILRVMSLLVPHGLTPNPEPTLQWLLHDQEPTGAFRTAWGFAAQCSQRSPGSLPEFRDLLPVAGWNDKVFRYLTGLWLASEQPATNLEPIHLSGEQDVFEAECVFRGKRMHYFEDSKTMTLDQDGKIQYRWVKGESWAAVCAPPLLGK